MKNFLIKTNISYIQKICLSGLFIALIMILNKVVAINYIPVMPFVRISLGGTALLIFASFLLGPVFGGIVGGISDILGYFIFDPKTFGMFPQITLIYVLLGVLPYFVFCLIRKISSKKLVISIEYGVFAAIFTFISIFLFTHNSFVLYGETYNLELYQKIIILGLIVLLFGVIVFTNAFVDKRMQNKENYFNVYQVSFSVFLIEVLVVFLFGTLMKSLAFGFSLFLVILFTQSILMFINIPLNTYLCLVVMRISKKYFKIIE